MLHFREWRDRCGKWDVAKAQVNKETTRGKARAEYSYGCVPHLKGWVGLDTDVSLRYSSWCFKSIFGNIKAFPTFPHIMLLREWGFQSLSLYGSYGVHTSLKIPPNAWFDRLALGCAIALEASQLRTQERLLERRNDERKSVSQDLQPQKLDNYAITSLLFERLVCDTLRERQRS